MLKLLTGLVLVTGTLFANAVPSDLINLKGSWTLIMSTDKLTPREGYVYPAVHLVLTKYTELQNDEQMLEGIAIGFVSNTKIADVTCVNDVNAEYSRSDYICSYDYDSERHNIFVNDIDSTQNYFLGEYIVGDNKQVLIQDYNNKESNLGFAVPKIKTIIIPMF
jgi:hypothetical protein